jgi:hypothetical protein
MVMVGLGIALDKDGRMASRFPAFSSRSVRVQIALAVIVVTAIAVTHVALQTGFVSFGSSAGAERAHAEPDTLATDGSAQGEAVQLIRRGAAASR